MNSLVGQHKGEDYFFCSVSCNNSFLSHSSNIAEPNKIILAQRLLINLEKLSQVASLQPKAHV